jgi:TRAP-type mannitol/chloroaromatic compound transport system permease small subunit
MDKALTAIDQANRWLGRVAAWCALVMMLAQAFSVVARYVFSYGVISVQEAAVYGHALIFLAGSALVLQTNEHVRVDIFYGRLSVRFRRWLDLAALLLFVVPVAVTIFWVSLPYVTRAWSVFEGSRQAGGIPAIFLLKTAILVFAVSVGLQALATALRLLRRQPPAGWDGEPADGV